MTLDCVTRINKKHYLQDHFIKDGLELDTESESYNKFEGESESDYFVLIIS